MKFVTSSFLTALLAVAGLAHADGEAVSSLVPPCATVQALVSRSTFQDTLDAINAYAEADSYHLKRNAETIPNRMAYTCLSLGHFDSLLLRRGYLPTSIYSSLDTFNERLTDLVDPVRMQIANFCAQNDRALSPSDLADSFSKLSTGVIALSEDLRTVKCTQ